MASRKAAKETAAVVKSAVVPQRPQPPARRPNFSGVVSPVMLANLLEQIGKAVDGERAGVTIIVSRDGPHSPDVRAVATCAISLRGLFPTVDRFSWTVDSDEIGIHLGTYAPHIPDPLAALAPAGPPPGEDVSRYEPAPSTGAIYTPPGAAAGRAAPGEPNRGEPVGEDPERVARVAARRAAKGEAERGLLA